MYIGGYRWDSEAIGEDFKKFSTCSKFFTEKMDGNEAGTKKWFGPDSFTILSQFVHTTDMSVIDSVVFVHTTDMSVIDSVVFVHTTDMSFVHSVAFVPCVTTPTKELDRINTEYKFCLQYRHIVPPFVGYRSLFPYVCCHSFPTKSTFGGILLSFFHY